MVGITYSDSDAWKPSCRGCQGKCHILFQLYKYLSLSVFFSLWEFCKKKQLDKWQQKFIQKIDEVRLKLLVNINKDTISETSTCRENLREDWELVSCRLMSPHSYGVSVQETAATSQTDMCSWFNKKDFGTYRGATLLCTLALSQQLTEAVTARKAKTISFFAFHKQGIMLRNVFGHLKPPTALKHSCQAD